MLQYVAVSCSILWCVAVCCSMLQYVAVCHNMLQCVAVRVYGLQTYTQIAEPPLRLLNYGPQMESYKYVHMNICSRVVSTRFFKKNCPTWRRKTRKISYSIDYQYGVATISRLLKITGLSCKWALSKRQYSAKETYDFKESTHRSLLISLPHMAQKQQISYSGMAAVSRIDKITGPFCKILSLL